MNKKNIKIKRSFIPQRIGDSIKKINRNFTSKFGKIEFIVHSNWEQIVGSYFAEFSEPLYITRIPDFENEVGETVYRNHLNVSVSPAAALEFQHFKDTILEKMNSYFGYKAIIDLRIQQNYITNSNRKKLNDKNIQLSEEENSNISKEVEMLTDNSLKDTLINLGKKITKDNK